MNKTRYFPTLPSVRINKISNGTQPKKDVNKSNKKIPIIVLSPGLLLSLLLGACTKAGTTSQTVMPTTSQAASTNHPAAVSQVTHPAVDNRAVRPRVILPAAPWRLIR